MPADSIPTTNFTPSGVLENIRVDEVTAICLLLGNRRFTGPVIVSPALSEDTVAELIGKFDVGVSTDLQSDTSTIL